MKLKIMPCLERVWLKVEDSLRDECVMLLTRSDLHDLEWRIRKFLEQQPIKTAKKATGKK